MSGPAFERPRAPPQCAAPPVRPLDCLLDKLILTDKAVHAYSLGAERVEDVMEMTRIAGGLTHEAFGAAPQMYTNINSTSPLKHDRPPLDGAIRLAPRGQPTVAISWPWPGSVPCAAKPPQGRPAGRPC